jgi:hypothetical protein
MSTPFSIPDTDTLDFQQALRLLKQKRDVFCSTMRPLHDTEIVRLTAQGNVAQDWTTIRVSVAFIPDHIRNNRFFGACYLGRFTGTLTDAGDSLAMPSGIVDSVLIDSVIGDECCIFNVKALSNYFVGEHSVLLTIGTLSCSPSSTFGNGREIVIGVETGGREVLSFAEMTLGIAEAVATQRREIGAYRDFITAYCEKVRIGYGVVESGCRISNCAKIVDTFFGTGAICDNATLLQNSTILCSPEEPVRIADGAYIRNSCIQWGCLVDSMAIVDDSILTEYSHVERHGKVTHSIIGPNTGIAEGEVTASLVGPFVGFHHQALLIGALWPEGKGNVAYGANVGSNHTSKAPDQEIYCGEGLFFGLGVNVKFPSDFTCAPYSIIATGVTTLPQCVRFPFSLINAPSCRFDAVPPAYNELFPGWVLSDNLYMVLRSEDKFRKRNKAQRAVFDFKVFRPEIIDLMVDARKLLRNMSGNREYYLDSDIPGVGKNFVTEMSLRKGIDAYSLHIERYCLTGLMEQLKPLMPANTSDIQTAIWTNASTNGRWEHQRQLGIIEKYHEHSLRDNLMRLAEISDICTQSIRAAKENDDIRGRAVMSGYDAVHGAAGEDEFVKYTAAGNSLLQQEIREML